MSTKRKPAPVPIGHCPHCRRTLVPGPPGFRVCATPECTGWTETATPAAGTPEIPPPVSVPMTRLDAWAVVRALAIANDVPEHYDGHRDEKHVRTWVAQRIINLLDPATDAAATVDAHCTGGCGDIRITRAAWGTGACPFCGRELDTVEGAHGD
jgi:hypothetical protein